MCDKLSESNEKNIQREVDRKPSQFLIAFYDYMEIFVVSITVIVLIFSAGIRLCRVNGESMEQTLYDGETLITINPFYTPKQGDIIVFHQTSDIYARLNEPVVKRVIATEGQWVDIDRLTKTVTIYDVDFKNSQILDESEYRYLDNGSWEVPFAMTFPVQVPDGCLFVMGDNRNNSGDSSSHPGIGFVDTRRVLGHVVCRLTPLSKFGSVD